MKNQKGFTAAQVAVHVSEHTGKDGTISTQYCYQCLHLLRASNERFSKKTLFSLEERNTIAEYAVDRYNRKDAEPLLEWIDRTGRQYPKPYKVYLPAKTVQLKRDQDTGTNQKYIRALERRIDHLEKTFDEKLKENNRLLIEARNKQLNRKNDPRVEKINTKIRAFCFKEPIEIKEIWNYCRKLFEQRNQIKVFLQGDQTFPQWLRNELQGFLDALHDEIHGQRELGL